MTELAIRALNVLAEHSVQATVVGALVFAAAAACRRAHSRARYAAWLVALAAFLLPPFVTTELAVRSGLTLPWLSRVSILPDAVLPAPLPGAAAEAPSAGESAAAFPWHETWAAAALIWLAGAGVSIALWARRSRRLRAMLQSRAESGASRESETLQRARAVLQVRREIRLVLADAPEPGVWGVLHPLIVMPRALADHLTDGELEAVLLHEVAHVKRHDALAGVFQRLVRALFWFHPVAWLVDRKLIDARESACDDEVVSRTGAADVYASGILNVCRYRIGGSAPGLAGIAGSNLKPRLEAIMQIRNPRNRWLDRALVASAALAGLAVWLAAGVAAAGPQPESQQEKVRRLRVELKSPYAKWVREDVAYIITAAERAEYLNLESEAAREAFIERFWRVRDPDPATPANEAKEEHYRRIAYTNERFHEGKPGWQTDRGRFYITFGPPDEIEAHPSDGRERWLYKRFAGSNADMTFDFPTRAR